MFKSFYAMGWLICLVVFSCAETQIDNNIRVLINGNVVDQNNQNIPNATIQIFADANATGAERVLLGEGESDADGNFSVTSLFGPNDLFYAEVTLSDQFSSYRYQTNTEEFTPFDLTFNLETVQLNELTTLTYNITRESEENNTLQYSFMYFDADCIEVYEEGVLDESQSFCNTMRTTGATLNNLAPNAENRSLIVPLQSEVEFRYSINDGATVSEIITVNSADYAFEFSY